MSVLLDRVNASPIANSDFPWEFNQWIANLVDTLNEVIDAIQNNIVTTSLIANTVSSVDVTTNTTYIPTNTLLTSFQLPDVTSDDIGSVVGISGFGAGGWSILTGAGQTIKIASSGASAGTSVSSSSRYDSINITLVDATTWIAVSTQTTGFVIV